VASASGMHPSEGYDISDSVVGSCDVAGVRRVRSLQTGEICALKMVHKTKSRHALLRGEVEIIVGLEHPHIARVMNVYEDSSNVYIVSEICYGRELVDRVLTREGFEEKDALLLGRQVFDALAYLHAQCIAHRDIKVEHILLKAQLKIIDFGSARRFREGDARMYTLTGSGFYVAPEVLLAGGRSNNYMLHYTEKCDVWSAGVLLYILVGSLPPFMGKTDRETLKYVLDGKLYFPSKWWGHITRRTKDLIRLLLTRSVEERPSAEEVMALWEKDDFSPRPLSPSSASKRSSSIVTCCDSMETP